MRLGSRPVGGPGALRRGRLNRARQFRRTRLYPSAGEGGEAISRLVILGALVKMLGDVLDELQWLATVYDSEHEVAFAAGEALGTTLGGGLYRCICAMNLGCEQ